MKTGRKPNILHVRTYITDVIQLCEHLQANEHVAPAMAQYVAEIKLIGKAILRKHTEKGTRKDVYVEA